MASIPPDLSRFLFVTLFSLLIGLEQRKHHTDEADQTLFGTDRTFSLIGILGFILYIISPGNLLVFLTGGVSISLFLAIYYHNKIKIKKNLGITSIVIALITYCLAPLIYLQPVWIALLIGVSVLILTEVKEDLFNFSKKFSRDEFLTLAKFIIIAGIVLPLLPHDPISKNFNISPYQLWLTIVAVSSISYLSYLIKKFVFPNSGILLTALLGGMYSSTATTIILARESKEGRRANQITAGILSATGMMYCRLLILAFMFNMKIAQKLLPGFLVLILASIPLVWYFWHKDSNTNRAPEECQQKHKNPLELKTAIVFGFLFAFFGIITQIVVQTYGKLGVNILSFIVGVTDIDPYILNLFQGGATVMISVDSIVKATIIATASNNLIKMIYAISLGSQVLKKKVAVGFSILIVLSFLIILGLY
ncbi:MgtC/SapB family protein [Desulfobacula sp.]